MRCEICGGGTKVITTRKTRGPINFKLRRRECVRNPKHRFSTAEFPSGWLTDDMIGRLEAEQASAEKGALR